jgi:ATPase subunit of ABC transporter with duplicated ATPase domains
VQWLMDYLNALTQTTVLIVSHDTPFLERVCSDGKFIHLLVICLWIIIVSLSIV